MMLTKEIDIYADGVADPDPISDLIDASIGRDSQSDRTFGYYGRRFATHSHHARRLANTCDGIYNP